MFGLGLLTALGSSAAESAPDFVLEELAPGVYLHPGRMADVDDPGRGDSANLGVVVGSRCAAVIDTGGAYATGAAFAAAIAARIAKPVCYVINTHVHFDHVLGNAAFAAQAPRFVGQHGLAEAMVASRDFFVEHFADELGGTDPAARIIGPDTLVDGTLDLDLGERRLLLRAVATAHSATDLTVHDPHSATLWTGDLLARERMPVLDGSLHGWLAWLDAATQENHALVVPGHGPVDRAWPAGAQALRRYLEVLRDETRAALARGASLEEALDTVAADETEHWQLTARAHRLNISRAYRELEWE